MKRITSALAGLALAGLAMGAYAGGGTGGTGSTGSGSSASSLGTSLTGQQIEGPVLRASSSAITVLSNGAAVSFNVGTDTKLCNVNSLTELKEGDQVRANFNLKDGTNQLTAITRTSGGTPSGPTGGTGSYGEPGSGTGGSGSSTGSTDYESGMGGSGSDTGSSGSDEPDY